MSDELKPCPFCGSEDVSLESPADGYESRDVKCRNCLATGPGVICDWNDRTSPPAVVEAGKEFWILKDEDGYLSVWENEPPEGEKALYKRVYRVREILPDEKKQEGRK